MNAPGSAPRQTASPACRCLAKDACIEPKGFWGFLQPQHRQDRGERNSHNYWGWLGAGISTPQSCTSPTVTHSLLACEIFWQSAFCKSKQLFHQHPAATPPVLRRERALSACTEPGGRLAGAGAGAGAARRARAPGEHQQCCRDVAPPEQGAEHLLVVSGLGRAPRDIHLPKRSPLEDPASWQGPAFVSPGRAVSHSEGSRGAAQGGLLGPPAHAWAAHGCLRLLCSSSAPWREPQG